MVYLFLADGFEEIEALTVVDVLRRAQIDINTVSITESNNVQGAHNIVVYSDLLIKDCKFEHTDMIIFPGGMPGTTNLENCSILQQEIKNRVNNNKWIVAICAALSILGKNGYLNGKNAICYPGFEKFLVGATIIDAPVVVSDNIITSKGPGTAFDFAHKIVSILKDEVTANRLRQSMQY